MNLQTLQVFDPAMCCATGVCGTDIDPRIAQFAADLDWLKTQSVIVQRHNLAQSPAAFVNNDKVKAALAKEGTDCLPLVILNGAVVSTGKYPTRAELIALTGAKGEATNAVAAASSCCTPNSGCC